MTLLNRSVANEALTVSLPVDILAELVEALYAPVASLAVGVALGTLVGLFVTVRSSSAWLGACTALL